MTEQDLLFTPPPSDNKQALGEGGSRDVEAGGEAGDSP